MGYFNILTEDILFDILVRIPTESVLDCKLLCKTWRDLIRNPLFSKMHLHQLIHSADKSGKLGFLASTKVAYYGDCIPKFCYFEYNENHELTTPIERIRRINLSPPFKINDGYGFDSCNGLICLSQPHRKILTRVCICNPITKEYVFLPQIKTDLDTNDVEWSVGFGYVSSTNEYKVVILVFNIKYDFGEFHVYTLGSSNGWRNLGIFEPKNANNYSYGGVFANGIFANGVLYWEDFVRHKIVAFDLAEEKVSEDLELPLLLSEESYYDDFMVLDGVFSVAIIPGVQGAKCYDIWQLKEKNDHIDTEEPVKNHALVWSKEFEVDISTPLAVTKNNGVLTYRCSENHLTMYDTRTSTSKRLVEFEEKFCQVIPHMNTFVSLKELGEENTKIMESIEIHGARSLEQLFNPCSIVNW